MAKYNPAEIEKKWQRFWKKNNTFTAATPDPAKPKKFYALVEFPYPSGAGLHVGHSRPFTAMDVIARKRRMEGQNVLYPIGFDAFGLPTENFAIKTGRPPAEVTQENIANFTRQLQASGFSFDWSRVIDTTDPHYFKWTQWLFLQFFKHGLAYKKNQPINWCPKDKIGLANEEVVSGCCERCGTVVEKRNKEQWMLAITKYAPKLLAGLQEVDYIPQAKTQQENWIGKSEGAKIVFNLTDSAPVANIEIFTSRPDTIYGATFIALSAELAKKWLEAGWQTTDAIKKYIETVNSERLTAKTTREEQEKNGSNAEIFAINPVSGEKIPVWITNYVLGDVGTGAIMGVPAHDERDFDFAQKFNLPIKPVVAKHCIEPNNPPRPNVKTVRRTTIHAIVQRKSDGAVLMLHWKSNQRPDGKFPFTFIIGGVENGEDKIIAARRELKEEAGITAARFVRELPIAVHTEYFAAHKNENRYADITVLHFEIDGTEELIIAPEELEKHEPVWIPAKDVATTINVIDGPYIWQQFLTTTAFTETGIAVNSDLLNDLTTEAAAKEMLTYLELHQFGKRETRYKLRDWVFSRQRYWGEPIPLVFCFSCAQNKQFTSKGEEMNPGWIPLPEHELPWKLPEVKKYEPTDTGESPLAAIESWVKTTCPRCGGTARRETDTMPNWAGSSWYFLRYTDPDNETVFASSEALKNWTPVDWYNGGMEHTVLHLLYSRFWNQFLFDIGLVPTSEPYRKRTSHGLILAKGGEKMSKSKGNVVNPDDVIKEYGADSLRIYIMFMGPFDQPVEWDTNGLIGVRRFLERAWNLQEKISDTATDIPAKLTTAVHQTIKKVTEDIENMRFNTAIAKLMELMNVFAEYETIPKEYVEVFTKLLAPFAPHISEELWQVLGHSESISHADWPMFDSKLITEDELTIAIQVNGKLRDTITVPVNATEEAIKIQALASEKIQSWLGGQEPKKVIYVRGKLLSIVV